MYDLFGEAGELDRAEGRASVAGAHGARQPKPVTEGEDRERVGCLMEALDRLVQSPALGGRRGLVAGYERSTAGRLGEHLAANWQSE